MKSIVNAIGPGLNFLRNVGSCLVQMNQQMRGLKTSEKWIAVLIYSSFSMLLILASLRVSMWWFVEL